MVVIHGISLPPKQYGGFYIDQFFTNTLDEKAHPYFLEICHLTVSSHLMINRSGVITQYVPFTMRAWHAGESSFKGRSSCNDYSIGIELEGADDEAYESIQYKILVSVLMVIMSNWPLINSERIVGHSDIAPGRKTDPGAAFDWVHLNMLIDDV